MIENIDFTDSSIWNVLKELPDQYKEKIVAAKLTDVLEQLVDRLPEVVFHPAFDGAFQQFSEEKTVNHLTVLAIYLSLLICTATLAGEEQSLAPLVDMLESGHAPIGLEGNTVYVI